MVAYIQTRAVKVKAAEVAHVPTSISFLQQLHRFPSPLLTLV
jgi:hypothetical protein